MIRALTALALLTAASDAAAQSLFRRPAKPSPEAAYAAPSELDPLRRRSLYFVDAPRPRQYEIHDQITIIVDETSRATSDQVVDLKKDYSNSAEVSRLLDLMELYELRLQDGDTEAGFALKSNSKFKGDGSYERTDRLNARVTAEVIDVKPNGILVLEARKSVVKDQEAQSIVLSGRCRPDDITNGNTVLSSQLADLTVAISNEGQIKDNATKGIIPRVIETIFNF